MADTQTPNVNDPSAAYTLMEQHRELSRTLIGGTSAMRAAGRKYLPQEPAETNQAYDIRLTRSVLFNAYRKAIQNLAGKVFSKPVRLKDDVPKEIQSWCEDVDLAGRNLHTFSKDVFEEAVALGVSYILVDYPPTSGGQTLAEERKAGVRPYLVHIQAGNLIGWKSARINGVETLTQVRIRETATVPDGNFAEKEEARVRVLELVKTDQGVRCQYTLWHQNEKKEWVQIPEESGTTTSDTIRLVPVYTGRTGFMTALPPLEDLADLNAAHWRSSSDQEHILHVARVPLMFMKCLQIEGDAKIEQGVNRGLKTENPNGDARWVEISGTGIEAGRESIQDVESRMEIMALQPLVQKTGTQTATKTAIDTAEAHSLLQSWALNLQDALELCLQYMGAWVGKQAGETGSVEVCTDFGAILDTMDLGALLQMAMAGKLTNETLWAEYQRRGRLSEDFDPIAEAEALKKEQMSSMGSLPSLPGANRFAQVLGGQGQAGTPGAQQGGAAPQSGQ